MDVGETSPAEYCSSALTIRSGNRVKRKFRLCPFPVFLFLLLFFFPFLFPCVSCKCHSIWRKECVILKYCMENGQHDKPCDKPLHLLQSLQQALRLLQVPWMGPAGDPVLLMNPAVALNLLTGPVVAQSLATGSAGTSVSVTSPTVQPEKQPVLVSHAPLYKREKIAAKFRLFRKEINSY